MAPNLSDKGTTMKGEGFRHDFGWALEQLRMGARVTRRGWNGKGMWLVFQKGYPDGIPINENTAQATGIPKGTVSVFLPYIMMKIATPPEVLPAFVPWLASQTDVLAFDWGYEPDYVGPRDAPSLDTSASTFKDAAMATRPPNDSKPQQPSVGRIVHVIERGSFPVPAIITAVSLEREGAVDLHCFGEHAHPFLEGVGFGEPIAASDNRDLWWVWPPRC